MEAPADVVPGLTVVLTEISITRGYHTNHVLMIALQELDHGFRRVSFSARAAVARCHEDVGFCDLFPASDLHRPGVEPIRYGLGSPG